MRQVQPLDELMQPTLQRFEPPGGGGGPRPWPLWAQFYMAVFGGPAAATLAAWLNSGRLDMPANRRLLMLGIGTVATVVGVVAMTHPSLAGNAAWRSEVRLGWRAFGGLLFGLFFMLQKSADRLYQVNARPEFFYSRALVPGILIVVAATLVNVLLVLLATSSWQHTSWSLP